MSNLNQEKFIRLSLDSTKTSKQIDPPAPLATSNEMQDVIQTNLAEFLDIYQNGLLTPVYQPIIDMGRGDIYGYEALIRGPKGSSFEAPLQLFRAAAALNMDIDFEILCCQLVVQGFADLRLKHLLFINVSPALLLASEHRRDKTLACLQACAIDASRIVIEVTEHLPTREYDLLSAALGYYRNHGFKVALDDLGAGFSSLRLWTEVLPDFIKIDKHFIRNIHASKIKQAFMRGLLEIAAGSNCRIIAEGVETREEFEFLCKAGINYQQGYYFAFPASRPSVSLAAELLQYPDAEHHPLGLTQDNLQGIARAIPPISASTTVREVLDKLQRNPELNLLPIVQADQAVGLVERFVFLNSLMQSVYGIDLYGKMNIIDYVGTDPVLLDIATTLEDASQAVTSCCSPVQAFIVTCNNKYYGVSTVLDLLHKITEQQICSARHANPLTLLPGIVPTNDAIDRLLYSKTAFALAYYDLDNFKPYNDHYGYDAGDLVIKKLADILRSIYHKSFSLIGHIGGDDFIVVDMSSAAVEHCQEVLRSMEQLVPEFYHEAHIRARGMTGVNRLGEPCFLSLLGISIGLVPPERTSLCLSHHEISDLASQAKKLSKKMPGNSLFIDQRL